MKSKTVILTRPDGLNSELERRLFFSGFEVLCMPLISVFPINVNNLLLPHGYDFVIFVSGNSVRFYLDEIFHRNSSFEWPIDTIVTAVGASTIDAFKSYRLLDSCINHIKIFFPNIGYDSESLLFNLRKEFSLQRKKVLIIRGREGRSWLIDNLLNLGSLVDICSVYDRVPILWSPEQLGLLKKLINREGIIFVFTSSQIVLSFFNNIKSLNSSHWLSKCHFIVIHSSIRNVLKNCLLENNITDLEIKVCEPSDSSIFHNITTI